jgi:hypothetical protein
MQLTLKVTPSEGAQYEVKTNLFTIVALERKFKIRASELANGIAMEHLAYLAYESCKQHDIVVPIVFDDYVKQLSAIEVVADEGNPTEAEVTPEP